MFVGQDFSAPNVHVKETLLLPIFLYFYIHRYSLKTWVFKLLFQCILIIINHFSLRKAFLMVWESSGSSADSAVIKPWWLPVLSAELYGIPPTMGLYLVPCILGWGKVGGDALGASLGALVAFFRGDGQGCSLVAALWSPALEESTHAQLPLLQLFTDPFSPASHAPYKQGTGSLPLGPLFLGAGQRDNRDTGQSWVL